MGLLINAQTALDYVFTGQSVTEYVPVSNGTVLWSGSFDDAISAPITIPAITYGGTERTSIKVSTNGYVAFGNSTASFVTQPISSNISGADGIIAPLGADLNSAFSTASVSYVIDGETVIVEWADIKRFGATGGQESLSFQLILDTANDGISFKYNMTLVDDVPVYPQVGMKTGGGSPAAGQYANRSVTEANTWLTSDAGATNTSNCRLTSAVPASVPESGLTYTWSNALSGCMDPSACNYDVNAESDNGSCEYCSCNPLCGCTDPAACNYDANATTDDGSCYSWINVSYYGQGVFCSGDMVTLVPDVSPQNGPLTYAWSTNHPDVILTDPASPVLEAWLNVAVPDFSTEIVVSLNVSDVNGCVGFFTFPIWADTCIIGCMDPVACNYDPLVNMDNGLCDYSCNGCTDENAWNYNPDATVNDGSCIYPGDGSTCDNPTVLQCGNGVYSAMTVGVTNDNAASDALACGGPSSGGQRWYIYEAAFSSEITVSTINALTNFDTYLKVYTGECGNLNCVVQNDDVPGTGLQSQVIFDAVAGVTYLIRVGGFASSQGTFGLTFECGGGCLDEAACNFDPNAPFDDGSCTYGQDCYGCTDPSAQNYDPIAVYDQGCMYSPQITVFHDMNGDGLQQFNEPGLPNWPVYIPALSATIFSNTSGAVSVTLPASNFELQLVNNGDTWISSNSSTQSVSIPDNMTAAFGLVPASGETFLVAGPYDGFWDIIHCEDGYEAGVFINNIGGVPLNGTLTMTCDPMFMPEADAYLTIAPDQVSSGFAQWNIVDFAAGSDGLFSFHIDGPGVDNIGQTFPFEFNLVLSDGNGEEFYNESWSTTPFIACSYDPNDLTATPEGYEAPHFILPGQRIQFRVRFQNTGNFPAEDVLIIDDLDPQVFDVQSFVPLYGSADYVACLHDDGTIDLIFEDIYLPDAENNEEESHGFIVFEVDARQDLIPGTVLLNQAAIFFDSNPAIITNETFHTIFDCSSFTPMTGDTQLCDGESLSLDADQQYVEYYEWVVNGEAVSQNSMIELNNLPVSEFEVNLVTGNPLCYEEHTTNVVISEVPLIDAGADVAVCPGEEIVLTAVSDDVIVWTNDIQNGLPFVPQTDILVTATATNDALCTASDDVNITLYSLPGTLITESAGILYAPDGATWQWYLDDVLLEGQTGQTLIPSFDGIYQVLTTSAEGCSVMSEVLNVTSVGQIDLHAIHVFPNPMNDVALISLPPGSYDIELFDITGRSVMKLTGRSGSWTLERGDLPSGQYHIRISDARSSEHVRLIMR
jgi:uncharacterized repeat protein (TIGR01451 family)